MRLPSHLRVNEILTKCFQQKGEEEFGKMVGEECKICGISTSVDRNDTVWLVRVWLLTIQTQRITYLMQTFMDR